MNILFVNSVEPDFWGSDEEWMLATGIGLQERGHRVCFSGRANTLFLNKCIEKKLSTFPLKIKNGLCLSDVIKLARLYRDYKIDVVITSLNKDIYMAGIAKRLTGKTLLLTRNGLPSLPNKRHYRYLYKQFVDGILTNTYAIKDRYLSYGWFSDDYIKKIGNGINLDVPVAFAENRIREKYSLPEGKPVLGIFGSLVEHQQHKIFLEVAKTILQDWPEATFLIVGKGPLREKIQQYAIELGIFNHVYILDLPGEIMELYSFCDIILQTSGSEGFPHSMMEAMLAGKPVVAFNTAGIAELRAPGKSSAIVPLNDIYAMTESTQELLNNPEHRRRMGQYAQKFVKEFFSAEKMIDEVENYLQEISSYRFYQDKAINLLEKRQPAESEIL